MKSLTENAASNMQGRIDEALEQLVDGRVCTAKPFVAELGVVVLRSLDTLPVAKPIALGQTVALPEYDGGLGIRQNVWAGYKGYDLWHGAAETPLLDVPVHLVRQISPKRRLDLGMEILSIETLLAGVRDIMKTQNQALSNVSNQANMTFGPGNPRVDVFELEPLTLHIAREAYHLSWFWYRTWGASIQVLPEA